MSEKISAKALNEKLRNKYLEAIKGFFAENGEDICVTASNEIAIPTIDASGNDSWVVVKISVPTGSRDGEQYDGYAVAEDYKMKQDAKAEKAKAAAEAKEKKKARDAEARAKKKAARENGV